MKIYEELAPWFPLLSAPEDYEEEAAYYTKELVAVCDTPPRVVLELGSGGGHNASFMRQSFAMVLVDRAPGMLQVSKALNPDCEHVQGDMRTVRLNREFDAVFVHDAVCYMTSESDLRMVIDTAYAHCRPGGAVLIAPDFVRENFKASTHMGGEDSDDGTRGMRYVAWCWDPDPSDTTYIVDYGILLRTPDGATRMEHDRHIEGVFPTDTWLRLFAEAGFVEARAVPFEHSELEPNTYITFVARKPARTGQAGTDESIMPSGRGRA